MVVWDLRKRNNTFMWTTIKITVLTKQEFLLDGLLTYTILIFSQIRQECEP